MSDGQVKIDVIVESKEAQRDLNKVEQTTDKTAKTVQRSMNNAAASTIKWGSALRMLRMAIPGLGIASIAVSIAGFITGQEKAKEAAEIHAKALRGLSEEMKTTAELAVVVSKNIQHMSEVQIAYAADRLGQEAASLKNDLNAILIDLSKWSLGSTGEFSQPAQELYDLINNLKAGKIELAEFQKELARIKNTFGDVLDIDTLKRFEDIATKMNESRIATELMDDRVKFLNGSLSASEFITRAAAAANDEFAMAIDKVFNSMQPKTLEDAIKYLQNYTKDTYLAQAEQKNLASATAQTSLALIAQKAALASLSGDYAGAAQGMKLLADFQQKLAQVANGQVGKPGGGGGGISRGLNQTASALQSIKDKIDEINRSEGESLAQRMEREWASMTRNLQSSSKELEELKAKYDQAMLSQAERARVGFDDEIAKQIAEMTGDAASARVLKWKESINEIEKSMLELGYTTDEVAKYQAKFIEAWNKQINTDHMQEQLSFLQELEQMSGQYGLSLQLQNQLIEEQAERYRSILAPEQQHLIDQWQELKTLMSDQSWEAGMTRAAQTFIAEWTNASKVAEKQFDSIIGSVQELGTMAVDAIFGDAEFRLDEFAKNLMKKLLEIAMNQMIANLIGMVFSFNPSGGGVKKGGVFHSGGIVGSGDGGSRMINPAAFIGAPRYHAGGMVGLSSNERAIIAQTGEGIFTAAQMRALAPVSQMQPTQVNLTIENNAPNTKIDQRQQMDSNGNVSLTVTVDEAVANAINNGPATGKALGGSFGSQRRQIHR